MHEGNYLEALRRIQVAKETDATELSIYYLGLKEVPKEIKYLTQLNSLNLTT